jgi:hypothetical protein
MPGFGTGMEYAIKAALLPTAAWIAWAAVDLAITNQSGGMFQSSKPVAIVFFWISILPAELLWLILALPFIALVRDIRGGKFWLWLAVGSTLAPLQRCLVLSETRPSGHMFGFNDMPFFCRALVASMLMMLVYLSLLKRGKSQVVAHGAPVSTT